MRLDGVALYLSNSIAEMAQSLRSPLKGKWDRVKTLSNLGQTTFDLVIKISSTGTGGNSQFFNQFSTDRPDTRENSFTFAVTNIKSSANEWAAMSMSLGPIGRPAFSSSQRSTA